MVDTKEISQTASKTSIESTEPSVPAKQSSAEVVAVDSTVVAETSPPKKTSWSPLGWFWSSKPVTSSQEENQKTPEENKEVAKAEPNEAASDNFIPAESTDLPTSVEELESSSVGDEVPAPETAPITEAHVLEVSEGPQVNQAKPKAMEAPSDETVPLGPGEEPLPTDLKAASAAHGGTAPSEQTSWPPLGWFSRSVAPVTSSQDKTQKVPPNLVR